MNNAKLSDGSISPLPLREGQGEGQLQTQTSEFVASPLPNPPPQGGRRYKEIRRLIAAFGHSIEGFKAVSGHPAFRIELIAASVMLPLSLFIGHSGVEHAMLAGSVFLVLIVELLNTGIEITIDRISTDLHPLSKRAKDIGSAAVLLSLVNAGVVWFLIVV